MGKHDNRRRTTSDPQFRMELDKMLRNETGDAPKHLKKGKKKDRPKVDVFGTPTDEMSKKKKKKKKDDDEPKSKKKRDKDRDDEERGVYDYGDAMDTDDAAKAITKGIKSAKLRKVLMKGIAEGKKSDKKKK